MPRLRPIADKKIYVDYTSEEYKSFFNNAAQFFEIDINKSLNSIEVNQTPTITSIRGSSAKLVEGNIDNQQVSIITDYDNMLKSNVDQLFVHFSSFPKRILDINDKDSLLF